MPFIAVTGLQKSYRTAAGALPVLTDLELSVDVPAV